MAHILQGIAKTAGAALIGIVCGAVISVLPLALINYKHLDLLFTGLNWQKKAFIVVCIAIGVLIYMFRSFSTSEKDRTGHKKLWPLWAVVYLCLYTACAVLCQRLNLATISLPVSTANVDMNRNLYSGADCAIIACMGLFLVILAAITQIFIRARRLRQDKARQRYLKWTYLVFMTGIPLVFSVWLPLLALPGAFVVLKWMDDEQEQNRSLTKR